jgi:very-short-patch-repair endonuclease
MKLAHAKQLRAGMTDAERRLWYHLRAHRFGGSKFKRQVPIGRYIVDFVCFDRKVIVEVDGGQHAMSVSDQARDEWLRGQGFRVLRFWNHDVLKNTEAVLTRILEAVSRADRYPSPDALRASPSPTRGEGSNDQRSGQS